MKILFLSHQSSRTGAPLILLDFLKWVKQYQKEVQVTVLSLVGGSLREEFKKIANVYIELSDYKEESIGLKKQVLEKIYTKLGYKFERQHPQKILIQELASQNFDVIYANTVVTIPLAQQIKDISVKSKIIAHLHELNTIIKIALPDFSYYIDKVDGFIAVSEMVRDNLINNYQVEPGKITTIYEFATIIKTHKKKSKTPPFIVGGSGTVHWRKGSDLFLQVAKYVKTYFTDFDIEFIWVGEIKEDENEIIQADISKSGLKGVVSFVGEVQTPQIFYDNFDVLLLTSREDPFPLVGIELGMLGKPLICFSKATGTAEIIKDGGGIIVPYLSIREMAEAVIEYYNNTEKKVYDGKINQQNFSRFTPEIICPKIFLYLNQVVKDE